MLTGSLEARRGQRADWTLDTYGPQTFQGIGFDMGEKGRPNVVLIRPGDPAIAIAFEARAVSYVVFLHAAADLAEGIPQGFGAIGPIPVSGGNAGNPLGGHLATYRIDYADGTTVDRPVLQRFAVQQRHIAWSASPFAAVPACGPEVFATASEDALRGRAAVGTAGRTLARTNSGRSNDGENLWLYALPNPHPERDVSGLTLIPGSAEILIYGIATTGLREHPLRPWPLRRLRLDLPPDVVPDALGELDTDDRAGFIGIDLGKVITARMALEYDPSAWHGGSPEVQPKRNPRTVIAEVSAHPAARLYLASADGTMRWTELDGVAGAALRWTELAVPRVRVRFRIRDHATGSAIAARLHVHGSAGEYLPPLGHHRRVDPFWFEDTAGELVSGENQYAYIPGDCEIELPLGTVFVELSKGCEYRPLRTTIEVVAGLNEYEFVLERVLDWRSQGWVTSDTHVHFLSPHTALLEGEAEGVNVVNLLAAQWGEMFSNVSDFDGRTTLGAGDFGGTGEFLVRVGTENRMHVLGHVSLLGYQGPMIHPLSTGGPQEGALGQRLEATMADWAVQCRAQRGLVVMPHAPNPQAERAANIVAGLVDAMELMTFNPRDAQLNPFGLADWYRYQNIGHQLPLVGGSDKMAATSVLGGIRTYARLGDRPFTYDTWMDAVRGGDTFVTVGPLIELTVDGRRPGERISLTASGGRLDISWRVQSVVVPLDRVELIVGGQVVDDWTSDGRLDASGKSSVNVVGSTWIALRVRGSWRGRPADIAAHTSSIQVVVGDRPVFVPTEAVAVLQQIEGAMAFVDTLAPRPEQDRLAAIRMNLERAHRALHDRMHAAGITHLHSVLHAHGSPAEH